jgi:hypothetical protein
MSTAAELATGLQPRFAAVEVSSGLGFPPPSLRPTLGRAGRGDTARDAE